MYSLKQTTSLDVVNYHKRCFIMAKNGVTGDGHRNGAVKERSQTQTPSGHWVKRDTNTGRFMDVKTSDKTPFKGVTKEK